VRHVFQSRPVLREDSEYKFGYTTRFLPFASVCSSGINLERFAILDPGSMSKDYEE
jgi:hypothetical protein